MGQMRHYAFTVNSNGQESTQYVKTHRPKDYLPFLSKDERAKPNHLYTLPDGTTVRYEKITADYYAESIRMIEEGPISVLDEVKDDVEISLRLSVNDDSHLTGDTIEDDAKIEALGFGQFLNKVQYEKLCKVAGDKGIAISAPCSVMTRFLLASAPFEELDRELDSIESDLSKVETRVSASPLVAAYRAGAIIPRQGRKSASSHLYGVVSQQRETIAKLERKVKQQEILLSNAKLRERELRIQFTGTC